MSAEIKQMNLLGGSEDGIRRGAFFPEPGFRRSLIRSWDEKKETGAFIGLNPGKADAEDDDQTSKKMVGFAKRWGWGAYIAYNLFEYVATQPDELFDRILNDLDVGPSPVEALAAVGHATVCVSWGNPPTRVSGNWFSRVNEVLRWLRSTNTTTVAASLTQHGHPSHLSRLGYVDKPMVMKMKPPRYPFPVVP